MRLLAFSGSAPIAMVLLHVLVYRAGLVRDNPGARLKLLARIELAVSAVWGLMAVVLFARLPLALTLLNTAYVVAVSLSTGYTYFIIFTLSETALGTRRLGGSALGRAGDGLPHPEEDRGTGRSGRRCPAWRRFGRCRDDRNGSPGVPE